MAVIETRQLGRRYGSRRGISGVSLQIEEGQIFGFLGPNGAGKTTTIRILLGFLKPGEGSAEILGMDCWKASHVIKRDVGYVAGDVRLYPWLSARRGLRIVGQIRNDDVMANGLLLAERFQLEPDLPVRKMSRGNRQKVALVLAMAHRPRVIILDEPTSGLDPLMQMTLMQCLREMAADCATILFSSHTLSEVEDLCDRVAMIRAGSVVVDETLISLKQRAPRTVIVRFCGHSEVSSVTWPGGVQLIGRSEDVAHLELTGESMPFLKWAASQPFADVTIETPSLETLFQAYYQPDSQLQSEVK